MSLLGTLANKEINDFLRTVTIKNAYFATRSRNRQLRTNSTSVPDNVVPYYKHIAGEYILKNPVTCLVKNPKTGLYESQTYSASTLVINGVGYQNREVKNSELYEESAFDEMMYVVSLDTGEEIPFTLENLHVEFASDASAVHEKTLKAYKVPGRYFDLLCEKYPAQVDLIKAIVYPVSGVRGITDVEQKEFENNGEPLPDYKRRRRDVIVAAGDFSLLACDETLLEELERHDLITYAKMILRNLDKRWNIHEFWKEQNYPLVLWTIVWCSLKLGLIARRYENIKTQFAHSSHVWDYLESKGMNTYRGYLTTAQTKFLYKNIEYILHNRGKQKVTNILVDEFLSDIGLNLKTKTIVLDTTNTLDASKLHHVSEIKKQCESCSRRFYCHKKITNFECPNFINVSGLCEAQPIVLTEEFVGARKSRIISALINQYGYSEADALTKYERSMIWRDDEVEAIRNDYDRDQLTDVHGPTESLSALIEREYECGLEPEFNDNVVAKQTKDLQHIAGTVAPTKLIELTKNRPSAKYMSLFNKFLTETLLHLAPRRYTYNDGDKDVTELLTKVSATYNLTFRDVNMNCHLEFGELLALMYMGVVKENNVDLFFDHCIIGDAYARDAQYYRVANLEEPDELVYADEVLTLSNASKIRPIFAGDYVIGHVVPAEGVFVKVDGNYVACTDIEFAADKDYYKFENSDYVLMEAGDYVVGDRIEKEENVYIWAPYKKVGGVVVRDLDQAAGHDPLTNFMKQWTYNFPVPGGARIKTTFKFGKPVPQQALVDAWLTDLDTDIDYGHLIPEKLKDVCKGLDVKIQAVTVKGTIYVVRENPQDSSALWEGWPLALKVEGIIKNNAFFPARDEVAIIPKYARWYADHLVPSKDEETTSTDALTIIQDGELPLDESEVDTSAVQPTETVIVKYDANKGRRYISLEIEKYFDLDSFLNGYVDLMENVTTQEQIGDYLTKMFTLLERTYAYAEGSPSVETQIAVKTVLETCLVDIQNYKFDLVSTNKTSMWVAEDVSRYPIERPQIPVAFYSDWLKRTDDLLEICESVDSNVNAADIWYEFNQDCIKSVLAGCSLPYVITADDTELTAKIKQLVTSLSSYKIAFLDGDESDRYTDSPVAVLAGSAYKSNTIVSKEYVSPIMDSVCNPHIACYHVLDDGCIMMRTPDTHAVGGKVYYQVVNTSDVDEDLENVDPEDVIVEDEVVRIDVTDDLNLDTITYEGIGFEEGTLLTPNTYYEKVDIKKILGVAGYQTVVEFMRSNGKWTCRIGSPVTASKTVSTFTSDYEADESQDAFISSLKVDEAQKKKLITFKYRKTIYVNDYGWTAWMNIPSSLDDYLAVFAMARTVYLHDKIDVGYIVENSPKTSEN